WPGTLIVVSHDRYFLERVTDSVWALLGDGQISMLPRGVDEYLERRAAGNASSASKSSVLPTGSAPAAAQTGGKARSGSSEERTARKAVARIDKRLAKITDREKTIHDELAQLAS